MQSKFWKTLLEVNDISFIYYVAIYMVLLVLDTWKRDFVFKYLHFPLSWLLAFVIVCGLAKLFFNLDRVISYIEEGRSFLLSRKIIATLIFLRKIKYYLSSKFAKICEYIFICSFLFYFFLFSLKQFKENVVAQMFFSNGGPIGWLLAENTGRMERFLFFIIFIGIALLLKGTKKQGGKRSSFHKKAGFFSIIQEHSFLGIFGAISGFLIFCKIQEFGLISYAISIFYVLMVILLSFMALYDGRKKNNKLS